MIVLGLTGSIGMGKTTTAQMFLQEGVPVHDADATVHRLYEGEAASEIEALFPGTVVAGKVDRERLAKKVMNNPQELRKLEGLIHPLVRQDAEQFLEEHRKKNTPLVVLDIPLLFEAGDTERVDKILVVTAPEDVQRERVLARPGMSEEKFKSILARQVPDAEKRRRADYLIDTSQGMDSARAAVRQLIRQLTNG